MRLPRLLCLLTPTLAIACVVPTKPLGGAGSGEGSGSGDDGSAETGPGDDDPSASGAMSAGSGGMVTVGGGNTEGGGTDDGPGEGTVGGNATMDDDAGSTGGSCGPTIDCAPCVDGCDNVEECIDGEWTCFCECDDTGTGAVLECDLEEAACTAAEISKVVPIDCGVATLDDDQQHWQTVHDCAQTNAAMQSGFKAVFDLNKESEARRAYVGQVGFVYAVGQMDQDLGDPQTPITYDSCVGLGYIPDCVVGVGFVCLQCFGDGQPPQLVCEQQ